MKLTVIIPVHNVEQYLERCLRSVLSQTLQDMEVICIDDASGDNSPIILEKFRKIDPRIKVIRVKKTGQGDIRNMGIDMARGMFTGFVDADDHIHPRMFEKLYSAAMRHNSHIAFCHTCCFRRGKQVPYAYFDREQEALTRHHNTGEPITASAISTYLPYITTVCWNKIYRTSFLRAHHIRFASGVLHEDVPFFFKAILNARSIVPVREGLYFYSAAREGSSTHQRMHQDDTLPRILDQTRKELATQLKDPAINRQFNLFVTWQLLSYIHGVMHQKRISRQKKRQLFHTTRDHFLRMTPIPTELLSFDERWQVKIIRRGKVKWLRARTLIDSLKYQCRKMLTPKDP